MIGAKLAQLGQGTGRWFAHLWRLTGKAPGWYYQVVERWGNHLSSGPLVTELINGCSMSCDLRDEVQRQIYFIGLYEPIESYLFTRIVQAGMVVVDVGANVGQYSLLASTIVGSTGHVHAFEPVPATFERFKRNVELNKLENVSLCRAAVWNCRTELNLGILPEHVGSNAGAYTTALPTSMAAVRAEAIRLDDYLAAHKAPRVDVIKVDIEGAELFALQGMSETLRRYKPVIFMEVIRSFARRAGYGPEQIWEFLSRFGYRAWVVRSSAAECHHVPNLDSIESRNIIFHVDDLPDEAITGWNLKSILRWTLSGSNLLKN